MEIFIDTKTIYKPTASVSVQEARIILGTDGDSLTDAQLRKTITEFELLARMVIKKAGVANV